MGKKYIIELEDKPFHKDDGDFLYRVKGFNSLVFDMTGIGMLTPYIEPDLEWVKAKAYSDGYEDGRKAEKVRMPDIEQIRKEAYEQGQEDLRKSCVPKDEEAYGIGYNEGFQCGLDLAWDAARKVLFNPDDGGMSAFDVNEVFGESSWTVMKDFSASEVVAKIKEYKEKQEEIKVWDEVKAFEKKPFIVTGFGYGDDEEDVYCYGFVTENGISTSAKKNSCVRTGRRLHDIDAVLEKMRNEPNAQIDT